MSLKDQRKENIRHTTNEAAFAIRKWNNAADPPQRFAKPRARYLLPPPARVVPKPDDDGDDGDTYVTMQRPMPPSSQAVQTSNHLVTSALDMGTGLSGYAFAFNDEKKALRILMNKNLNSVGALYRVYTMSESNDTDCIYMCV